jgi:hypothetical protein
LKLDNVEKEFIEKIAAISGKDKSVIKEVLKALLIASTLEIYAAMNEDEQILIIPYTCKCIVRYCDKCEDDVTGTKVSIEAQPSQALIEEISNISEGNITPTERQIRRHIIKDIQQILDINEVEIDV